jgi:hypothetical protein
LRDEIGTTEIAGKADFTEGGGQLGVLGTDAEVAGQRESKTGAW